MKIRITKKGLPKAQMWNSQIGNNGLVWGSDPRVVTKDESEFPFSQQPSQQSSEQVKPMSLPFKEIKLEPNGYHNFNSGFSPNFFSSLADNEFKGLSSTNDWPVRKIDPQQQTPFENPSDVMPIKRYSKNKWMNANQTKKEYFLNEMQDSVNHFIQNPTTQKVLKAGDTAAQIRDTALVGLGLIGNWDRNREIEKTWRKSLISSGPVDTTEYRGDYEQNTGMVDPYNTGAKSKGQFAGLYYPVQMQIGGPLSYENEPVRDNILIDPFVLPTAPPMNYSRTERPKANSSSRRSSGANEEATQTWDDISSEFEGVKHLGIWGDKSHQKRKSDHNSGDALDIGIQNAQQGNQIAQKLIQEAKDRNVKYVIWNKQIWNPSISDEWRPYTGPNPHTSHVHVSFNRNSEDLGQISYTHNNPLNIHDGSFSRQYGGRKGSDDAGGFVSIFPDMDTGIQAAKDLLFGPKYADLTISQARNKWVKGNPNTPSNSSMHIVKAMGSDKKLKDLSPSEREKLIKQFAKWEGQQAYDVIKNQKLYSQGGVTPYKQGGVYELSDEEINDILANGGEVEFL